MSDVSTHWETWIGVAAFVVALSALVVALVVYLQGRRAGRRMGRPARRYGTGLGPREQEAPGERLVAFVANPSKPGVPELRETLVEGRPCRCRSARCPSLGAPADPGRGQARDALAAGADVVVAVGGDGTVRAVAEAMAGSGKAMGILPRGTGNLLARNLDISTTSVDDALATVLSGHDRHVDVGRLRVDEFAEEPVPGTEGARDVDHLFLVIAGLGFDAAMVADADPALKSRVGWMAYFVAGVRHLHGRRTRMRIELDDAPAVDTRVRSLMVGNCGLLPGGITLIPDAVIDDGRLDVVAIDARAGLVGWAQVLGEVVMQGIGVSSDNIPARAGRIDTSPARRVKIEVEGGAGEHVQVDGDLLGRARRVTAWVEPGTLVVRSA